MITAITSPSLTLSPMATLICTVPWEMALELELTVTSVLSTLMERRNGPDKIERGGVGGVGGVGIDI